MLPVRLFLFAGVAAFLADPGDPLRVLRATPSGDAAPGDAISVSFDRPVAGSLDRTVDPARVLSITPAIAGTMEWRDPITVRFIPAGLLTPDTRYTVTVATTFEAMDGSTLEAPYEFSFRVRGPRVLASSLDAGGGRYLRPDSRFALVMSAPVEPQALARAAYLEFGIPCPTRTVRLRVLGQREIGDDDPWFFQQAGGWERNRAADPLRRVVQLEPATPMPHGCTGELVAPAILDKEGAAAPRRFGFATYGDFRIAGSTCPWQDCPTGPARVKFSTPVRGGEVLRHVRLQPAVPFTVVDTAAEAAEWTLQADLKPRAAYAIIADSGIRDAFGQPLQGNPVTTVVTTGYAPTVDYTYGRLLVERDGFRTLAVRHINIDTLEARIVAVPESLEAKFLARANWGWSDLWEQVAPGATVRRFAVPNERDHARIFGVPLPVFNAQRPVHPTLLAVRISSPQVKVPKGRERDLGPLALVQVSNLGVHSRVGLQSGTVWVTGANDGRPRRGASVSLRDSKGALLARAVTDSQGLARLSGYEAAVRPADDEESYSGLEGYVTVVLGNDRALVGINQWDPDLAPWRFGTYGAWDLDRAPLAATVFTERGIYRPGERVFAKTIVRRGTLGALHAPERSDSIRWTFSDREGGTLEERIEGLSPFGTADHAIEVPAGAPLGDYAVAVAFKWGTEWFDLARTYYRVAEYRPPEFLVSVTADTGVKFAGQPLHGAVEARYLFGAPMARAEVKWTVRTRPTSPWELTIPNTDGYHLGEETPWWEYSSSAPTATVLRAGVDTLDAAGRFTLEVPLAAAAGGLPSRATVEATVTDVNRQAAGGAASVVVHPSDFYLAAKPQGTSYFWTAGTAQQVGVLAVTPTGVRVQGVPVRGRIIRREWHRVHRERDGLAEQVGEWVMDTVARCDLVTGAEPATCRFTPASGGIYVVAFSALDPGGRESRTSFMRWASGSDWVPWNDETQFKMDVIADRQRYSVGDTATVLFASPFTDAEAWITVEREGILEERRLRLTSGSTTLRFPVTEAYSPNAFISIIVARGRSARPGPLDDPGRPTIRVGYASLRVSPEVKRLEVAVEPLASEYRPGDTARVRLRVRDARGRGQRSEVALWAVDEGVLALTGYKTPDPIDGIYRERGLGLRLASNLVAVAPQVPEGEKGRRSPGGGGGGEGADILRSRFQSTAFFIGSVITDSAGQAVASARLPDNLTTFRVMAVAVTPGDRYGSGQSPMLVTRPLLARPALPRFVRPGDVFNAGVVVNQRAGGTPTVTVRAQARGITLTGEPTRQAVLEAGRGREVRFGLKAAEGDSATVRFDVSGDGDADAVQAVLPIRPAYAPRAHTVAGLLADTATVEFDLPADIDPDHSRLDLSLGTSPLTVIRSAYRWMRVYSYYCSEQISSAALSLLALYQAQQRLGLTDLAPKRARPDIERAVAILSRRQRSDGGIGYWSAEDWTSPWLTAEAGLVLLQAKEAGIAVSDSVFARVESFLVTSLQEGRRPFSPVAWWYDNRSVWLSERVAAVDLLSQLGHADAASENDLLRQAPQLSWEDRLRLAEVLARRSDTRAARALLAAVTSGVRVEGRRAVLPDSVDRGFYFSSSVRPVARLLTALLAVEPTSPLIGPVVETLVTQGRGSPWWYWWNTQDYGSAVYALAAFERTRQAGEGRGISVRSGRRTLLGGDTAAMRDSSVGLGGLLRASNGRKLLRLTLTAAASGPPVYYYLTVREVPQRPPVTPDENGVRVERWYEDYRTGQPVTEIAAGELVRVRLRITTPVTRHFLVLDDALPAGLEAVDLSLRTTATPGVGITRPEMPEADDEEQEEGRGYYWGYGSWDSGWWSPFDYKEIRDDRVVYFATLLWRGTFTATYVARATTPGVFRRPPAQAEEMYNPAVNGRSDGGVFTVR